MRLKSWKANLTIRYSPALEIVAMLECPVCKSETEQRYAVQILLSSDSTYVSSPTVWFGDGAKLYCCAGCGVSSRLLEDHLDQIKLESKELTRDWVMKAIWEHPDFPGSEFARLLSEEAAKYHAERQARRDEAKILAERTPEEVEADRRWREEHRWCGMILGEAMENCAFWPAFEFRCADCGRGVTHKGYTVDRNRWGDSDKHVCGGCAERRLGCECQTGGD